MLLRKAIARKASNTTSRSMSRISYALLLQQDDVCSAAILKALRDQPAFKALAAREGNAIVVRDAEDAKKLAVGIDIAKAKGILSGNPVVSPVTHINVSKLTAEQTVEEILKRLPNKEGNVIVMQGLSGTGKGTAVQKLQKQLPKCVTWSNGNVFRSYTYLCLEALGGAPITEEALTPELLKSVEGQVTFEHIGHDEYDIVIKNKLHVADLQNTLLKKPEISASVPTVAQQTQGEVIRFGAAAVKKLSEAGYNIILEGREQTLNHIPTSLRFELVMDDVSLLGERRAAQRVMASANALLRNRSDNVTDDEVMEKVLKCIGEL